MVDEFCQTYKSQLDSKSVIDTTNTMFFEAGNHASNTPILSQTRTMVAKAFNAFSFENLSNPDYKRIKADHLICRDNQAVEMAKELFDVVRFNTINIGDLENVILLENIARTWGDLAFKAEFGRQIG